MAENFLKKKARALKLLALLKKAYPDARCSLRCKSPLQLLVSTILSAQCTDKRVNEITPALFARYRAAEDFAGADIAELEKYVRSTGFYHNKARNIRAACRIIVEKHGGEVPRTMGGMLELPGVARKTANIVLGNAWGVVEGVPVDTHAIRLSRLMGLTKNHDQNRIEKDLMRLIPQEDWLHISNLFVHHGRAACIARRPMCGKCPLNGICPKAGLPRKRE